MSAKDRVDRFIEPSKVNDKTVEAAISNYRDNLPKIEQKDKETIGAAIANFLKAMGPLENVLGIRDFAKRIDKIIESNEPLVMRIIGFPFKSHNVEEKVISQNPDMGEYIGFVTLNHIAEQINALYPAGGSVEIIRDGQAYDEKNLPPYKERDSHAKYKTDLEALIKEFLFVSFCLKAEQFATENMGTQEVRKDAEFQETKKDITTFFKNELGKNTKNIEEIAERIAETSSQFSSAVRDYFKNENYIRLSVHPHENINVKCGINLMHGSKGTPWHNTPFLVINEEGYYAFEYGVRKKASDILDFRGFSYAIESTKKVGGIKK